MSTTSRTRSRRSVSTAMCLVSSGRMAHCSSTAKPLSTTVDRHAATAMSSGSTTRPWPMTSPVPSERLRTSASTNRTVLSCSAAKLNARLIAVKVLPSDGRALLTIMILLFFSVLERAPKAFLSNLRLISRYSSLINLRALLTETKPLSSSSSKYHSFCLLK